MDKIGFLFSGSGAQYPGMMWELYNNVAESRRVFDEADDILGQKLSRIIFEGTQDDLNQIVTMMLSVFVADMASYAAISSYGIIPEVCAGFSLGEWCAITAAGVIGFDQALRLVKVRAEAMMAATPKEGAGMLVILKQSDDAVKKLCAEVSLGYVCPANFNYDGQVTVSGTNDGLNELEKKAREKGMVYKRIPVAVPSHCALMQPAVDVLEDALKKVVFQKPLFPIISNATARLTEDPEEIKNNIIIQLVKPVLFGQTIKLMMQEGTDCLVELGPGKVLSGFVKKVAKKEGRDVSTYRVENMETMLSAVGELQ